MSLRMRLGILLVYVLFVLMTGASASGDDAAKYKVGDWGNFAQGALSITFDDNENSDPTKPEQTPFNDKKFHITLFVETGSCSWANCKASFAKGHEIASHSVTHPGTMPTSELSTSQKAIQQNVPGEKCATIAYPNCNTPGDAQVLQYYIAGRNCNGNSNPKSPTNWAQIGSKGFGSGSGGYPNDANSMNTYANSSGWGVELHHGIGSQSHSWATTSLDAMKTHLDYLDKNRDKIWTETFGNVARYIHERDKAKITAKSATDNNFTITVAATGLDTSIYNYPLCIRRELPSGWTTAKVLQTGNAVPDTIITDGSTKYIQFNAVPNGADVVISKDGASNILRSFASQSSPSVLHQKSSLTIDAGYFGSSGLEVTLYNLQGKALGRYAFGAHESTIILPIDKFNYSPLIVKVIGGGKTYIGKFMPQL